MAGQQSQTQVAREVAQAVRKLDGLSILPAAAKQFLSGLFEARLSPAELVEIIESEPAFAIMLFSLAGDDNLDKQHPASIRKLIERLPLRQIRDKFFSLQIYRPFDGDTQKIERRREMVTNAVAVAACAREIADESGLDVDGDEAYTAGLLYSIGNLALDEAMPRSFSALIGQSQAEGLCISEVQQRNLGVDYTILGKRLAVKWHLPEQVQMVVWLHRSRPEMLEGVVPQADLVQAVQLGVILAHKFEIGRSGSFDSVELPPDEELPGISRERLEDIGRAVSQRIESRMNYTDWQRELADYGRALQAAAAQLADECDKTNQESKRAQSKSSHFDFATEFLTSINVESEPIEIAERFVCQWQKFYQTGAVCLYIPDEQTASVEAVIVRDDNQSRTVMVQPPAEEEVIPRQIQHDFVVIDAADVCWWLFERIDVPFDTAQTKVVPLLCRGRAIGAIVFEFRYPVATPTLKEMFEATCFIAATVLNSAFARVKQQRFAERFARLAAKTGKAEKAEPAKGQIKQDDYISALAEMAAGAGHELNNPLSVISGRAQLLAQESPQDRAEVLKQIQDNCGQLRRIVEDLMSFAEPAQPRKALVALRQIVDEAIELAAMKTQSGNINAEINIAESVNDVFVDSGQIVSSLANVISNAIESYDDKSGPVRISALREGDIVRIEISDEGRGMDGATLAKATYPFFSSKPAGRKRGMGLAYAARFIELNGGTLELASEPAGGTTAKITLPGS